MTGVAVLVAGCGSTTGETTSVRATSTTVATTTVSAAHALGQWGADVFAPRLDGLGSAFAWIGGAMQSQDYADARAGCRELDTQVDELEAILPAPDERVTTHLQEAAAQFRLTSQACQGLSPRTPQSKIAGMRVYQEQGQASLQQAVDLVELAQDQAGG